MSFTLVPVLATNDRQLTVPLGDVERSVEQLVNDTSWTTLNQDLIRKAVPGNVFNALTSSRRLRRSKYLNPAMLTWLHQIIEGMIGGCWMEIFDFRRKKTSINRPTGFDELFVEALTTGAQGEQILTICAKTKQLTEMLRSAFRSTENRKYLVTIVARLVVQDVATAPCQCIICTLLCNFFPSKLRRVAEMSDNRISFTIEQMTEWGASVNGGEVNLLARQAFHVVISPKHFTYLLEKLNSGRALDLRGYTVKPTESNTVEIIGNPGFFVFRHNIGAGNKLTPNGAYVLNGNRSARFPDRASLDTCFESLRKKHAGHFETEGLTSFTLYIVFSVTAEDKHEFAEGVSFLKKKHMDENKTPEFVRACCADSQADFVVCAVRDKGYEGSGYVAVVALGVQRLSNEKIDGPFDPDNLSHYSLKEVVPLLVFKQVNLEARVASFNTSGIRTGGAVQTTGVSLKEAETLHKQGTESRSEFKDGVTLL